MFLFLEDWSICHLCVFHSFLQLFSPMTVLFPLRMQRTQKQLAHPCLHSLIFLPTLLADALTAAAAAAFCIHQPTDTNRRFVTYEELGLL